MACTRTYRCDVCENEWTVRHASSDEPFPDCEQCSARDAKQVFKPFAINGVKSKAIDITQKMMEEQGYTNFKDNNREGDSPIMAPSPIQSAEAQQIVRSFVEAGAPPQVAPQLIPQVQNYWQGQSGAVNAVVDQARQAVVSGQAAAASHQATKEGVDAISVVKKAPPMKMNVMARANMSGS